jgi:hypothetical protein
LPLIFNHYFPKSTANFCLRRACGACTLYAAQIVCAGIHSFRVRARGHGKLLEIALESIFFDYFFAWHFFI